MLYRSSALYGWLPCVAVVVGLGCASGGGNLGSLTAGGAAAVGGGVAPQTGAGASGTVLDAGGGQAGAVATPTAGSGSAGPDAGTAGASEFAGSGGGAGSAGVGGASGASGAGGAAGAAGTGFVLFPPPADAGTAPAGDGGMCANLGCFDVFDCALYHPNEYGPCKITKCDAFVCKP